MVWAFKCISMKITPVICLASHLLAAVIHVVPNAALRCERRLAILERSETAKRCESLLNALLYARYLVFAKAKSFNSDTVLIM
ncbi:hypothetical protein SHAM105786_15965 [Shewanella amazonensis]